MYIQTPIVNNTGSPHLTTGFRSEDPSLSDSVVKQIPPFETPSINILLDNLVA